MPAFKDEFSPALIAAMGGMFDRAWRRFPSDDWSRCATDGLTDLELMQRVDHLARCLGASLPDRFEHAAEVLYRLLEDEDFDGWMMLPVGYYVASAGIDEPDTALPLLAALTPRFSSEGPIRPFIERHPETTYAYLHRWTTDPDEHVRRLVSEGTRPRLPWAPQLKGLMEDPSPAVDLLDKLYDDDSEYVRRSVANHLNDISKDHPDLALGIARRWQADGIDSDRVVRHGLRTLVKRGDPRALAILGFDERSDIELSSFAVEPKTITIGQSVTFTATLSSATPAKVAIDYVVHYQGARGPKAGKVFKLTQRTLSAGEPTVIVRRHSFEHVSIRRIHPGPHRIELQVNGHVLGGDIIDVRDPDAS